MSNPETTPMPGASTASPPLKQNPNYRWYLLGGVISLLGDQFTLIALPWLVLVVSRDPLHLAIAIGMLNLPRAVLILVGGAIVDRHSPKKIMMLSKVASTALLLALVAAILGGPLQLWMIYALAFGLGLSSAFSIPAGTSLLPRVVAADQLQAANSAMLVLRQLSFFVGPILAGLLIASLGAGGESKEGLRGFAVAFVLDALSFALSGWTLSKLNLRKEVASPDADRSESVLASIADGIRFFWSDPELRICFLYWAAVALLVIGPMQVGLPVLATTRFIGVASAFGILMGAHGGGTLIGMIISGSRPGAAQGRLGMAILVTDLVIGLLFIALGQAPSMTLAVVLLVAIGMISGFIQVSIFTWIQRRAPVAKLGRVMSLFMLIFIGLSPVSAALAGVVLRVVELPMLFAGCGVALVATVLLALLLGMRRVSGGPMRPANGT